MKYANFSVVNNERMRVVIHELIHNAVAREGSGTLNHQQMYSLAYEEAAELKGNPSVKVSEGEYSKNPLSKYFSYSTFSSTEFDSILRQYCNGK